MHENAIAAKIVDAAYHVHTRLGPGLLETVYRVVLGIELDKRGLAYRTEVHIPMDYDGVPVDLAFRADMIVEDKVVVEVKAVSRVAGVHTRQLRTYLRVTGLKLGILANSGCSTMKAGLRRVINGQLP